MCPVSLGSRYWCYPAGRLVTHFFLQSMQMVPVPPGATDVMGHALCGLGVVGVGVGWFCGFVGFQWDLQVSGSNGWQGRWSCMPIRVLPPHPAGVSFSWYCLCRLRFAEPWFWIYFSDTNFLLVLFFLLYFTLSSSLQPCTRNCLNLNQVHRSLISPSRVLEDIQSPNVSQQ